MLGLGLGEAEVVYVPYSDLARGVHQSRARRPPGMDTLVAEFAQRCDVLANKGQEAAAARLRRVAPQKPVPRQIHAEVHVGVRLSPMDLLDANEIRLRN